MPMYRARKHTAQRITGWVEFEAQDDKMADLEAHGSPGEPGYVDVLQGEWVELERITCGESE